MVALTKLKIAAVQMTSTPNWEVNLRIAEEMVSVAAANGAHLVILPEFFIQITTPDDPNRLNIAESFGHGRIQERLARLAQQQQIYLLSGTLVIKAETFSDKFFNTALIYTPEGKVHCRYDKIHLFKFDDGTHSYDEGATFLPGNKIVTCEVAGFTVGLSICYDLRFPELYRMMGKLDIIVLPSAFTYVTGAAHWEILSRARAIENQCYFIAVNQGGNHQSGRKTYGHTLIIDPWGQKISECELGEHIIYAELDKAVINDVRTKLPALEHRRV